MSIFVSLLGLAFLILIHEAGHFFVARGVGMNPRKFYLGFPPAIVKTKRNGIEYGVGAIPLGGYVKIPGMHRPAPGDLDVHFGRAIEEAPPLGRPVGDLRRAPRRERLRRAPWRRWSASQPRFATRRSRRSPGESAERGLDEIQDALAPDAYWRAPTWKRVAVIFAGPAANLVLRRRHLRRALHVAQRQLPARVRAARHERQGHRHGQRRARRHAGRGGRRPGGRPDPRDQRQAGRRGLDPPDDPGVAAARR